MRMHKLTSAFLIAMLTAGALHVSVQPAAASEHDDKSLCAKIAAAEMKIENKSWPEIAKELAIIALYASKKAAGCEPM